MTTQFSYAVVGGGISGLAAAYYLRKTAPQASIVLFEAGSRLGGVLETNVIEDYLIESSADMFVTQPDAAWQLCCDLGIEDQLLVTNEVADRAFIGLGDQIFPVPAGLSMMVPTRREPILATGILTDAGKTRFLSETEIPARSDTADESLKSFATRRFGQEAYEKIIQPMVSGIYTADPDRLSMAATMQRFVEMERRHGSLIKALESPATATGDRSATGAGMADKTASGARYGLFRAPQNGMQAIVDALVQQTPNVQFELQSAAGQIRPRNEGWVVELTNGKSIKVDGVIVATPAAQTAALLTPGEGFASVGLPADEQAQFVESLSGIETASSAIVILGVDRKQLRRDFTGFGIIYPHIDEGQVIAISFSSNKFDHRCDAGRVLIRCFIGGAMQSELVDLDDEALIKISQAQLSKSIGVNGPPHFQQVIRWRNCMPQYHLGHLQRVQAIESAAGKLPGLELAGNSYWGVGIPACVESGKKAAERLAEAKTPR